MSDDFQDPDQVPREQLEGVVDLLAKIERNTAVVRAWVRFFGLMWLLSALAALILWATHTGEASIRVP